MNIAGLQVGHNPSACIIQDGKLVWYNEERRLSKIKKIGGVPYRCIDQLINKNIKIDKFVVTGYDFNQELMVGIEGYLKYKNYTKDSIFSFYHPHHLSHLFKSFIDSGFKKARVFVIDGRGSNWYLPTGVEFYETCSIYDIDYNNVKCIYKKGYLQDDKLNTVNFKLGYNPFYNKNDRLVYTPMCIDDDTEVKVNSTLDLGHFYSNASNHCGFHEEEGKFMGYQSYGSFNKDIYALIKNNPKRHTFKKIKDDKDFAFTAQFVFENQYKDIVKKYKTDNMVFTGGTALNVVNNYKIQKEFNDCNLWFDPLCEDNGNCIGVAYAYLYFEKQSIQKLQDLYIGEVIKLDESLLLNEKIKDSIELNEIIKLLNQGEVVGLVQGKAEAGPRALGNRSLLLDPTLPNAKDLMNNIKQRENFRPFACSILENKANNYFEMLNIKQSPFMMYAPQAKKLAKDTIPSLVHVDNTCRIQTINNKQNSILYNILKMFKVPVIMNTSFNLAGYPIVETFEDVLFTLRNSSLKYVYFADYKKLLIKND
jgi:carbamoyltransferase